jgi:DNA-directed RNA polymerase specialized sigma24 family protein
VSDESSVVSGASDPVTLDPAPLDPNALDPHALDQWFGPEMNQRLVAVARRYVRDRGEAEDVAQEALLRARGNLDTLRSPAKAEAWLFRICRHAAIDHARSRRVRRAVWAPMPEPGAARIAPLICEPGPDPQGGDAVLDLHALPAHQRLLVSLHYEHGFSHPTLCRMTGLLPSALRVRLYRARGLLVSAADG